MRRYVLAFMLAFAAALTLTTAWAAPPAAVAEGVRSTLMDAQIALMVSPGAATAPLAEAEQAYRTLGLGRLEPAADARIREALGRA